MKSFRIIGSSGNPVEPAGYNLPGPTWRDGMKPPLPKTVLTSAMLIEKVINRNTQIIHLSHSVILVSFFGLKSTLVIQD